MKSTFQWVGGGSFQIFVFIVFLTFLYRHMICKVYFNWDINYTKTGVVI